MHDDARGRGAALAGRAERAPQRAVDREVDVRVVHHHDHVLAAHLQMDVLELRRAGDVDVAADFRRAGERDHADLRILEHRLADFASAAGDDVPHALRQSRFFERLGRA